MATALDLLMSTKEDVNLLSEQSDICTIDAKTRIIFVPSTIVVGGVQSDKNAERIKFSCPKIVGDNLDLSKFSVRINFENVSSVDFNVSIKDQYICDDVAVDGENVTFSWLIGRNAARYMGTVRFIVCAVKTDSDSNISVEWNTTIAEVPVLEGIEIDQPQIGQEEKDVINQLLELTKNTSAEAVQNVNSAKEQAIKDIQSVSQPDTTLTIEGGLAEAKATGEAIGSLKEDISNKITKFYASNQGETHITDSDNRKIQDMMLYGKSSQDGVPTPENPVEIKSVVNPTVKVCGENLYPGSDLIGLTKTYTTDFIPVILHKGKIYFSFDTSSDTSDGRYHINAKYFDINKELMGGNGNESIAGNNISHVSFEFDGTKAGINHETIDLKNVSYVKIMFGIYATTATKITYKNIMISATDSDFEPYKPIQTVTLPYTLNAIPVESGGNVTIDGQQYIADYVDVERGKLIRMVDSSKLDNTQSIVNKTEWLLAESQEIDLTTEEITAFKALTTYYPTTNISVNSEQLDGYTAFNYPISMANGWNYVKKQLNDNRDYIYDMDIQSAEAYVNSEYAVALTELEV